MWFLTQKENHNYLFTEHTHSSLKTTQQKQSTHLMWHDSDYYNSFWLQFGCIMFNMNHVLARRTPPGSISWSDGNYIPIDIMQIFTEVYLKVNRVLIYSETTKYSLAIPQSG